RLLVGLRAGADRDVHAPDIGGLVVIDLGEDDVLLDADGVVAAPVKALGRQPAEIAHARQCDVDQAVDELVHARLAQRHLAADRWAVTHLERGDRFPGLGDHRLLAGDEPEVGGRRLDLLAVVDAFADAHVDDDLLQHRHLHAVLVAAIFGEPLAYDLVEMGPQPRRHALFRAARLLLARLRFLTLVTLLRRLTLFGLRLLRLLALVAFVRTRRLPGLAGLGLVFSISHRSLLPCAWRSAPCVARRPRPRI